MSQAQRLLDEKWPPTRSHRLPDPDPRRLAWSALAAIVFTASLLLGASVYRIAWGAAGNCQTSGGQVQVRYQAPLCAERPGQAVR